MKTLGIILIAAASGAVATCVIMRLCKKKKLPCGCNDKKNGTTTADSDKSAIIAESVSNGGTKQMQPEPAVLATGQTPNDWAMRGILKTYNIVQY